jgi:DNA modification methylase
MTADIIEGDAIGVLSMLDEGSAHCIVTSPPYYGLRDYKVDGQIGMEKTPEEYVARLVAVFREARRVLRDDGTFWLNIGDSYSGSGRGPTGHNGIGNQTERQGFDSQGAIVPDGLKPKDLIGIPWMLAFALRADGWYLRSDIPWIKRNSMPSSVKDRPSSSIEHVFLLSKSKSYYYDYVATMQPSSESYNKDKRPRGVIRQCVNPNSKYPDEGQFKKQDNTGNNTYTGFNARYEDSGTGLRYMRDSDFFFRTWQGLLHNEDGEPMAMVVNPRGYKGAHFACFPVQLVEPMILAGTSEKGVCPKCGKPWVRDIEKISNPSKEFNTGTDMTGGAAITGNPQTSDGLHRNGGNCNIGVPVTTGWHPTCSCNLDPIPATVLDPFAGSCATGVACQWHNRNFIGIELNADYIKLGEKRLQENK